MSRIGEVLTVTLFEDPMQRWRFSQGSISAPHIHAHKFLQHIPSIPDICHFFYTGKFFGK